MVRYVPSLIAGALSIAALITAYQSRSLIQVSSDQVREATEAAKQAAEHAAAAEARATAAEKKLDEKFRPAIDLVEFNRLTRRKIRIALIVKASNYEQATVTKVEIPAEYPNLGFARMFPVVSKENERGEQTMPLERERNFGLIVPPGKTQRIEFNLFVPEEAPAPAHLAVGFAVYVQVGSDDQNMRKFDFEDFFSCDAASGPCRR